MKKYERKNLEGCAKSAIESFNRKVAVTPYKIQGSVGIKDPHVARDILMELYRKKFLLKARGGTVYYVNPNPPSALPYYLFRKTINSRR